MVISTHLIVPWSTSSYTNNGATKESANVLDEKTNKYRENEKRPSMEKRERIGHEIEE